MPIFDDKSLCVSLFATNIANVTSGLLIQGSWVRNPGDSKLFDILYIKGGQTVDN